jgi:hypothetical protein
MEFTEEVETPKTRTRGLEEPVGRIAPHHAIHNRGISTQRLLHGGEDIGVLVFILKYFSKN